MKKILILLLSAFLFTGCSGWKFLHNGLYLLDNADINIAFAVFGEPTNKTYIGDGDILYSWLDERSITRTSGGAWTTNSWSNTNYITSFSSSSITTKGICLVQIRTNRYGKVIDYKYQGDKGTCDFRMVQAGKFCRRVRKQNPEKQMGKCKWNYYNGDENQNISFPPFYLQHRPNIKTSRQSDVLLKLKGKHKSVAFDILGLPDGESQLDGRKLYSWTLFGENGGCKIKALISSSNQILQVSKQDAGGCNQFLNEISNQL